MRKYDSSTVSGEHNNPVTYALKSTTSADLEDHNLIKCVDQTISLSMKAVDSLSEQTLSFECTENAQSNVCCPQCWLSVKWWFSGFSLIESHLKATDEENDSSFLSLEELLRSTGDTQELQHAATTIDHGSAMVDIRGSALSA